MPGIHFLLWYCVNKSKQLFRFALSYYSPNPSEVSLVRLSLPEPRAFWRLADRRCWQAFAAAIFLISVPVFIEAPLVRTLPWVSLAITLLWFGIGIGWRRRSPESLWPDLLIGFAWTWLAGSIYWGWLRLEPTWHLPIEAIGVPFAVWSIRQNYAKVGYYFYLGSLVGTSLTDVYYYLSGLIPYWRQFMVLDINQAGDLLPDAIAQATTPWGLTWGIILAGGLVLMGCLPLLSTPPRSHWWAFSGAVLSTILVDGLFFTTAIVAAQWTL